jgi:hypothetical protein
MTHEQPPTGKIDPATLELDRPARSWTTIGLQFLLGFVIGGLLLVPLSYSSYFTFSALSGAQPGFAILLPLSLGLLAAVGGDRLATWFSTFLDSLPSL